MKAKRRGSKAQGKEPARPRNPLARELADPRYRKRVVKNPDAYKRKPKHVKPVDGEDG